MRIAIYQLWSQRQQGRSCLRLLISIVICLTWTAVPLKEEKKKEIEILTQIHDHLLHIQIAKWEDSCVRDVFFGVSCVCFRGVHDLRNDYRCMISKELNTNRISSVINV